jgi:hypothetical protein
LIVALAFSHLSHPFPGTYLSRPIVPTRAIDIKGSSALLLNVVGAAIFCKYLVKFACLTKAYPVNQAQVPFGHYSTDEQKKRTSTMLLGASLPPHRFPVTLE